jgi:hypothetical protein
MKIIIDPDNRVPFPNEPRDTSVQCACVPTNPYQGKVAFTGRIIITRAIQKRPADIDHEDTHYFYAQRRLTKEISIKIKHTFEKERVRGRVLSAMELSDLFIRVKSDNRAKILFGNPGRAIDIIARPHGRIVASVDQSKNNGGPTRPKIGEALDHMYHLSSITTYINLHQTIPARLEES